MSLDDSAEDVDHDKRVKQQQAEALRALDQHHEANKQKSPNSNQGYNMLRNEASAK
jgi:hypothetical protein